MLILGSGSQEPLLPNRQDLGQAEWCRLSPDRTAKDADPRGRARETSEAVIQLKERFTDALLQQLSFNHAERA